MSCVTSLARRIAATSELRERRVVILPIAHRVSIRKNLWPDSVIAEPFGEYIVTADRNIFKIRFHVAWRGVHSALMKFVSRGQCRRLTAAFFATSPCQFKAK